MCYSNSWDECKVMKVHVSNPPLVDGWLDQMTSQELGVNEFDSVYPIKMLSK